MEVEYLKHAYSFLPSEKVTAVGYVCLCEEQAFILAKSDYLQCVSYLEEEYRNEIKAHWNEYMRFKQQYGGYKHSWVNRQFREKTGRCISSPVNEEAKYNPVHNTSGAVMSGDSRLVDYLKVLSERRQASDCLTNARILNMKRSEEARGYGKFLTSTKKAVGV